VISVIGYLWFGLFMFGWGGCFHIMSLKLESQCGTMDYPEPDIQHRRLIWASVASLAALLSQYTIDSFISSSMSQKPSSKPPKAQWSTEETRVLIDFLHQHRDQVGDDGHFKRFTYQAAADHLAPFLESGPRKTAESVKTKWVSYVSNRYNFGHSPLTG